MIPVRDWAAETELSVTWKTRIFAYCIGKCISDDFSSISRLPIYNQTTQEKTLFDTFEVYFQQITRVNDQLSSHTQLSSLFAINVFLLSIHRMDR